MRAAARIPHVRYEEDVFAADETKLHTLSRAQIDNMMQSADAKDRKAASEAPTSGIRLKEETSYCLVREQVAIAPHDPLPKLWADDEDEPTVLSERMLVPPSRPPTAVSGAPLPQELPGREIMIAPAEHETPIPAFVVLPSAVAPRRRAKIDPQAEDVNRRALIIGVVVFFATLVPSLWALTVVLSRP